MEKENLFARIIREGHPAGPAVDVEELRARVLARVRRDNPEALKNPRLHEGYLRSVATLESGVALDVVDGIVQDILGYGPLQRYIYPESRELADVTEVMVTRYDRVYIEKDGRLVLTETRFRDEQHLLTTLRKIVMSSGRRLSETEAYVDAHLPDGSRVTAVIPPATRPGHTTMTLRRFPRFFSLTELVERETLTPELLDLLREAVKGGYSIVFSGPMGSGKTTLMNAAVSLIKEFWGRESSLVIFEDVPELQPDHENVRYLTGQPPGPDGRGGVSLADLARSVLVRLRPEWLILSECRGPETYYVVQGMCLGHPAMTSLHAESAVDAVCSRLPALLMTSPEGKAEGYRQALARVAVAVDLAVHMAKVRFGDRYERRVVQVAEVLRKGTPDGEIPEVRVLFKWDGQRKRLVQVAEPELFKKRQVF